MAYLDLAMGGALEPAVHDRKMSRRSAAGRRDLEQKIGYAFADDALLEGALTHISALSGKNRVAARFYDSPDWPRFKFWEQAFLALQGPGAIKARRQILRHLPDVATAP